MKKLLSSLGAFCLVVSATSAAVACNDRPAQVANTDINSLLSKRTFKIDNLITKNFTLAQQEIEKSVFAQLSPTWEPIVQKFSNFQFYKTGSQTPLTSEQWVNLRTGDQITVKVDVVPNAQHLIGTINDLIVKIDDSQEIIDLADQAINTRLAQGGVNTKNITNWNDLSNMISQTVIDKLNTSYLKPADLKIIFAPNTKLLQNESIYQLKDIAFTVYGNSALLKNHSALFVWKITNLNPPLLSDVNWNYKTKALQLTYLPGNATWSAQDFDITINDKPIKNFQIINNQITFADLIPGEAKLMIAYHPRVEGVKAFSKTIMIKPVFQNLVQAEGHGIAQIINLKFDSKLANMSLEASKFTLTDTDHNPVAFTYDKQNNCLLIKDYAMIGGKKLILSYAQQQPITIIMPVVKNTITFSHYDIVTNSLGVIIKNPGNVALGTQDFVVNINGHESKAFKFIHNQIIFTQKLNGNDHVVITCGNTQADFVVSSIKPVLKTAVLQEDNTIHLTFDMQKSNTAIQASDFKLQDSENHDVPFTYNQQTDELSITNPGANGGANYRLVYCDQPAVLLTVKINWPTLTFNTFNPLTNSIVYSVQKPGNMNLNHDAFVITDDHNQNVEFAIQDKQINLQHQPVGGTTLNIKYNGAITKLLVPAIYHQIKSATYDVRTNKIQLVMSNAFANMNVQASDFKLLNKNNKPIAFDYDGDTLIIKKVLQLNQHLTLRYLPRKQEFNFKVDALKPEIKNMKFSNSYKTVQLEMGNLGNCKLSHDDFIIIANNKDKIIKYKVTNNTINLDQHFAPGTSLEIKYGDKQFNLVVPKIYKAISGAKVAANNNSIQLQFENNGANMPLKQSDFTLSDGDKKISFHVYDNKIVLDRSDKVSLLDNITLCYKNQQTFNLQLNSSAIKIKKSSVFWEKANNGMQQAKIIVNYSAADSRTLTPNEIQKLLIIKDSDGEVLPFILDGRFLDNKTFDVYIQNQNFENSKMSVQFGNQGVWTEIDDPLKPLDINDDSSYIEKGETDNDGLYSNYKHHYSSNWDVDNYNPNDNYDWDNYNPNNNYDGDN